MVEMFEIYKSIRDTLLKAGIPDAGFEADTLIQHVTGRHRFMQQAVNRQQAAELAALANRRAGHEPLQYLLGSWPFMGLELKVGPGVLVPRPETEEVCLVALEMLADLQAPAVLDLCSGTGALALGIQSRKPAAVIGAVEVDEAAFAYLLHNLQVFQKAKGRAPAAIQADVLVYYKQLPPASVDLIVANPPYVSEAEYAKLQPELYKEPKRALVAPEDGLLFYRVIAAQYRQALRPGGTLVLEIGAAQGAAVRQMLENSYGQVQIRQDAAGHDRIAVGKA